jgi:hypothetical protein
MSKHRTPQYRPGSYLMTCDRSGRVDWAENFRREWDGLMVHKDYFEERNPQDFVYAVPDQRPLTVVRPDGEIFRDDVTADEL